MRLRLLTYNIHQGRTARKNEGAWVRLRDRILELEPDVVVLQEVAGAEDELVEAAAALEGAAVSAAIHEVPKEKRIEQLQHLSGGNFPHVVFGKNAVFRGGFHGNAVLSRFPIVHSEQIDLSLAMARARQIRMLPRRGMLHVHLAAPNGTLVHLVATHFGLLEFERANQRKELCRYVREHLRPEEPLLVAGDFNDWRQRLSRRLHRELALEEVFLSAEARHARTFPARFPLLCLDRIYYRGVSLERVSRPRGEQWGLLSDHLPILADFQLAEAVTAEKKTEP